MHRRFNNSPTTSEEPSYTEEILQETKQRLRNLELESEKIDRSFKEYYGKDRVCLIFLAALFLIFGRFRSKRKEQQRQKRELCRDFVWL